MRNGNKRTCNQHIPSNRYRKVTHRNLKMLHGSLWSESYSSGIYIYPCNQYQSPLKSVLGIYTLDTTLCNTISITSTVLGFLISWYYNFSFNRTNPHIIAEISMKLVLNIYVTTLYRLLTLWISKNINTFIVHRIYLSSQIALTGYIFAIYSHCSGTWFILSDGRALSENIKFNCSSFRNR
jgi:hypothetical protein